MSGPGQVFSATSTQYRDNQIQYLLKSGHILIRSVSPKKGWGGGGVERNLNLCENIEFENENQHAQFAQAIPANQISIYIFLFEIVEGNDQKAQNQHMQ